MKMKNFVAQSITKLRPFLNPASYEIYSKRFTSSLASDPERLVYFTKIGKIESEDSSDVVSGLIQKIRPYPKSMKLDLTKSEVMQVKTEDIEVNRYDKFGQIIIASKDDINVRYGNKGIAPSAKKKPIDLLEYDLAIPAKTFGVLDIHKHVPFLIEAENPKEVLALSSSNLTSVFDYEENKKKYSFDLILPLPKEVAKLLFIKFQDRIFSDRANEYFYEEITSKAYKPTKHNRSSGTLMNFESEELGSENSTNMHYHPGERSLHIFTTNKPAAATLNFCGIAENPDERKDCEVHLDFPKNSFIALNFPPYTHHKFHGDFVCLSVHPREGENLIEMVKSGNLPKGFLETATVFSATEESKKKWNLSLPVYAEDFENSKTKVPNNSR